MSGKILITYINLNRGQTSMALAESVPQFLGEQEDPVTILNSELIPEEDVPSISYTLHQISNWRRKYNQ